MSKQFDPYRAMAILQTLEMAMKALKEQLTLAEQENMTEKQGAMKREHTNIGETDEGTDT